MSDRDRGATFGQPFECELDLLFRFRIEGRSGFVEQENRSVLEQSPRNRDALLLPAGKETTFVADERLVAFRLRHDEVVRVGVFCRRVNFLLSRVEAPELDVLQNGVVKQEGILRDEPDLLAERALGQGT